MAETTKEAPGTEARRHVRRATTEARVMLEALRAVQDRANDSLRKNAPDVLDDVMERARILIDQCKKARRIVTK